MAAALRLALGELLAPACFVQPDLLALHLARVPRHKAGFLQGGLKGPIVVDQRPGDAVTHGAGLAGFPTTLDVDGDIEGGQVVCDFQRLTHDHAAGLPREELVDRPAVDRDLALAGAQKHARDGAFPATGSVEDTVFAANARYGAGVVLRPYLYLPPGGAGPP